MDNDDFYILKPFVLFPLPEKDSVDFNRYEDGYRFTVMNEGENKVGIPYGKYGMYLLIYFTTKAVDLDANGEESYSFTFKLSSLVNEEFDDIETIKKTFKRFSDLRVMLRYEGHKNEKSYKAAKENFNKIPDAEDFFSFHIIESLQEVREGIYKVTLNKEFVYLCSYHSLKLKWSKVLGIYDYFQLERYKWKEFLNDEKKNNCLWFSCFWKYITRENKFYIPRIEKMKNTFLYAKCIKNIRANNALIS